MKRRRSTALAAAALLATLLAGIQSAPAAAATTFTKVGVLSITPAQVKFHTSAPELCLSIPGTATAGTGSAAPQVTAWSCSADSSRQLWEPLFNDNNSSLNFGLWNPATGGCLDDWGGQIANGSPVKLYGPAQEGHCLNPSQQWSLWTDNTFGGPLYLAPAATWTGQVLSIRGSSPGNGAKMIMWHYGANSDQTVSSIG
jgi:hypothetical protein